MRQTWFIRLILLTGAVLAVCAAWQLGASSFGHSKRAVIFVAVILASGAGFLALLGLSWRRVGRLRWQAALGLLRMAGGWLARRPALGWVGLALLCLCPPLSALVSFFTPVFAAVVTRLWLVWVVALVGAALLYFVRRDLQPAEAFLGALLLNGGMMLAASQVGVLSTSDYSLGWSEASRYYNASLFFAPQVYGLALPLPTLHPTRYFLQGLAFLIPGSSIAFHRLWQSLLWLGCGGLAAWSLARRLNRSLPPFQVWLAGGWAFAFFFVGPIYYHLVLCAVPVLLGFDRRRFWRTLLVVLLGSVWAGLSRINWFPVPGVLAVLLYLFEEPQADRPFWRYLLPPAAWAGAGAAAAVLANQVYVAVSGNSPEVFGSAFSSPLLWYRLWPNATYGPGIIQSAVIAFVPVLALLLACLLPGLRRWKWVRLAGLGGVLGVFLAGGLVVSAKIGGGGDLHNLDNFVLFLAVAVVYLVGGRFVPDRPAGAGAATPPRSWVTVLLGGLVVVLAVSNAAGDLLPLAHPRLAPDRETEVTAGLQKLLDQYQGRGPVLLITQRQLLTFHNLQTASFEAEYEKVFLMEMAMANNRAYLDRFEGELQAGKFALIVTEPLNARMQGQNFAFSEENNAWVERVEYPILASYKLVQSFKDAQVDVYAPK